jgi:hypothetical protein
VAQDGNVLSIALARALRDAGLQWAPARGDTFVMPDRDMDSDVFVLSDMTIEVHQFATGPVIGFNGTAEWALDSVEQSEALWVPAEHQLRERLGDAFAGLAPTGGGYRVTLRVGGVTSGFNGDEPAEAYARALLHLLGSGESDASAGPPTGDGRGHHGRTTRAPDPRPPHPNGRRGPGADWIE